MRPEIQLIIFGATSSVVTTASDALVIEWASAASDNTPQIWITGGSVAANDALHFFLDTVNTFNSGSLITAAPHIVSQAEIDAGTIPITIGGPVADGTWYARGYNVRAGVQGANSNIVSQTIVTAVPLTFDSASKSTTATLSNGNLDVVGDASGFSSVRTNIGKTSGKWRVEFKTIGAVTHLMYGIADDATTPLLQYLGFSANTAGLLDANGGSFVNGFTNAGSPASGSVVANDVWDIDFDVDAKKAWISKNGVCLNSGDPAAGTSPWLTWSGTYKIYGAATVYDGADKTRLVVTPVNAPPSGFSVLA